jgi:EAL domain-containing protein (putative c-di-GMP-specific phosphodiesterase class I)
VYTYCTERMPLVLTFWMPARLAALALACSDPTTVLGYVFAATWFYALYGATWRAVLRAGLVLTSISARLAFWQAVPGHTSQPDGGAWLRTVPLLLICVGVARQALVRWEHPTRGLLQPVDFIDTAERTGAIIDIGVFALRLACADIAEWRESYPEQALSVHVNVSAGQLDHGQFIHTVLECLELSGLPPDRLVLELTETVLLSSPAAIDRLKAIAAHGVQIAIDDFGTGYSSLTTLRSLPVDVVKLDTSFIAGALSNAVDRTVIKAIVQMSSQLGLYTIAEGVERPEQQHFLHEVGTDAVQGYLYQRAVPPPELDLWLEGNLGAVEAPARYRDGTATQAHGGGVAADPPVSEALPGHRVRTYGCGEVVTCTSSRSRKASSTLCARASATSRSSASAWRWVGSAASRPTRCGSVSTW